MAKKVSEMNPEELECHRALAKDHQRRRREKLQGKALEEYRAQCSQHQKRYKKGPPSDHREHDESDKQKEEARPSRHWRGRAIEASNNGQGKQDGCKLRPYVETPQLRHRCAGSSDEEEDLVSDNNGSNNGNDGDEARDDQVSDNNADEQADDKRNILHVNLFDNNGKVNQDISNSYLNQDIDDGMEWNNGNDGMDVMAVTKLLIRSHLPQAVIDESHLQRDMVQKMIPQVVAIREGYNDEEGELPMLPVKHQLENDSGKPITLFHKPDATHNSDVGSQSQREGDESCPLLLVHDPEPSNCEGLLPAYMLSKTNLVANILAPMVEWTSGQRTVLPFLPKCAHNQCLQNILGNDANYTTELAHLPEMGPSSPVIIYLNKNTNKRKLFQATRDALSRNLTIVVRCYVDTNSFEFNLEGLQEHLSISPRMPVEAHNMALQVTQFNTPHVNIDVKEFVGGITDTSICRVTLGFPLPQYTTPFPFEKLNNSLSIPLAQTQNHLPIDGIPIPADVWTVCSWSLGHHTSILTYPHHDAEGASTFIIVLSGMKNWVAIGIKDITRKDLPQLLQDLSDRDASPINFLDRIEAEMVHLYHGDLVIIPPSQYHTVYTPVAGFCHGGHFFNFNTMHLTELSRFIDTTKASYVTNDAHLGTLETLCRMVISWTILPESQKLYRQSLVALCGMVVHHDTYVAESTAAQVLATLEMAIAIR
ncbi:hypothetical protein JVT61DRAFT_14411 [Boletus reticuloceps]|uniref:JmjC domain-containing protein n=1 Tax=Boletus reticuloceps TaxID=495285 RepID=A0A8I2YSS4_9AGAM|nr:hypothetical protein JVT61DRAFT_14411 [Boletus reticuloceps]